MLSSSQLSSIIPPCELDTLVTNWLKEDCPSFDYGALIVGHKQERATLLCKSRGVLAGRPFFDAIFRLLECAVEWYKEEGEWCEPICRVAVVTGEAHRILQGERVALNCLSRASGVATTTARYTISAECKWKGKVAGTRKTTPGFRLVEKYALLVAGADTHRYDLSGMVMIKDNHVWSGGAGAGSAVRAVRGAAGFSCKVEVECRSVAAAVEACAAGADVVMFDNFSGSAAREASQELKRQFPRVVVESSGGIHEGNIREFMCPTVDVISMSVLTQGYSTVNFSLKVDTGDHDITNPRVQQQ